MNNLPELKTERLLLRSFKLSDAFEVQRLAGDKEIAVTTLAIPHPYPDGEAERWIGTHKKNFIEGTGINHAITLLEDGRLLGAIGLVINKTHNHAELGYWMGKPYWNKGYTTEAARVVIKYGFDELGLDKIFAHYMSANVASGRVMEKIGMKYEGTLRQHVKKWEKFHDMICYGILKGE